MTGPSAKAEQKERRALAGSTATTTKDATTFHALANLDTSLKGDFSTGGSVSGSAASTEYPRLPAGPWADPVQVPPEPALGFPIDAMEAVGEAHEVAAAALILEARAAGGSVGSVLADTSPSQSDPARKEDE